MSKVIRQLSFNKRGHMFDIFVLDNGKMEGAIDASEKKFAIKELKNDTVYFVKKQPIVVDKKLIELDGLKLAFNGVESGTQKIEKNKCDVGFEEYCVHNFKIGNNKYRMVERNLPGIGIIVNPDYKISDDMPHVGGLARRSGDLVFWDYYFPETGWKQIRELTKNETICFEIIMEQGCFVELAKAEAEQQKQEEESTAENTQS